jgi:hypothetical protein
MREGSQWPRHKTVVRIPRRALGGVEGPCGALVVKSGGGVEGGAVEEEVELGLAGLPSPSVREAVDDVVEDEAVVGDEEVGSGGRA